jgi:DNA-binding transcriptional LysR family regulator
MTPSTRFTCSLGEEGELVAIRVEQEELSASRAVLTRFAGRGEPVGEYGAVEVVDIVDLQVQRRSRSRLDAGRLLVGGEGQPEPVDVTGELIVIALTRPEGLTPRIVAETSDLNVMVQLVAEDVGVALMPRSGRENVTDVVAVPITRPTIDRRIMLVWRRGATPPAARAFITLAREQLG